MQDNAVAVSVAVTVTVKAALMVAGIAAEVVQSVRTIQSCGLMGGTHQGVRCLSAALHRLEQGRIDSYL